MGSKILQPQQKELTSHQKVCKPEHNGMNDIFKVLEKKTVHLKFSTQRSDLLKNIGEIIFPNKRKIAQCTNTIRKLKRCSSD